MPPRSAKKSTASPAAAKKTPAKTKQAVVKAEETTPAKVVLKEEPKLTEDKMDAVENGAKVGAESEPLRDDREKLEGDEDNKDEKLQLDDNEPEADNEDTAAPVNEETADIEMNEDGAGEEEDEEERDVEAGEADGAEEEGQDEGDEEGEGDEGGHEGGEGDEDEKQINDMPAPLKDRQRQKEYEIFVGGLDKEANEEDLKKVFGDIGEIVEVRMSKNATTKKNKGFAFIRYATVEQAKQALTELKNPQVREKQCGVSPSQDNDTLYLGNICKTWTKEAVREKLKEYVENIEEMVLMEDSKNEGQNRGYAFLEFATHQDAMNAYRRLQKRDVVFGCDRTAKVAFAESSIRVDEEIMAQVKTVFLDGLSESWDEERVKEEMKKYGEIEKVQLSRNMSSAKRKDYGFVSFLSREDALACVEGVNKSELGEGDNKIKANIAKPQHKSRLVKQGVRGGYRVGEQPKGNKSQKGRPSKRFKSKGGRGLAGRVPVGRRGQFHGKDMDGKKDKAVKDNPKSNPKKDNEQKRKRDNERKGKVEQSGSRRDGNKSRRINQGRDARVLPRSAPYPRDSYTRHLELVNSYVNDVSRPYGAVSGSKRPYTALDDVPRYAEPALRHQRPRLDYDVGGTTLYGGNSYGQSLRLGRTTEAGYRAPEPVYRVPEAGYSGHARSSYGLYDSDVGYGRSSLSGAALGGGYASGSMTGRADIVGSSYSSLYSSRRPSAGYLPGHGSGAYY